jgi:hypothetical protein
MNEEILDLEILQEEIAVLKEQFAVACQRAEAWKELALKTREQFGVLAELSGTASGLFFGLGHKARQVKIRPGSMYQDALTIDAKLTKFMKELNVPIPEILRGEVE